MVFGLCEWNTAEAAHEAQLVVLGDVVDVDVAEVARRANRNYANRFSSRASSLCETPCTGYWVILSATPER